MVRPWKEIGSFYRELADGGQSLQGMHRLVQQIEASPYASGIYGTTSMSDLLVTQTPQQPVGSNPGNTYLRVSPRSDGTIELRYVDTHVEEKQWHRVVKNDEAFAMLVKVFEALHWFGYSGVEPKS
jgi:hypothetical protein